MRHRARHERGREHVARPSGVLADEQPAARLEQTRCRRPAEVVRERRSRSTLATPRMPSVPKRRVMAPPMRPVPRTSAGSGDGRRAGCRGRRAARRWTPARHRPGSSPEPPPAGPGPRWESPSRSPHACRPRIAHLDGGDDGSRVERVEHRSGSPERDLDGGRRQRILAARPGALGRDADLPGPRSASASMVDLHLDGRPRRRATRPAGQVARRRSPRASLVRPVMSIGCGRDRRQRA